MVNNKPLVSGNSPDFLNYLKALRIYGDDRVPNPETGGISGFFENIPKDIVGTAVGTADLLGTAAKASIPQTIAKKFPQAQELKQQGQEEAKNFLGGLGTAVKNIPQDVEQAVEYPGQALTDIKNIGYRNPFSVSTSLLGGAAVAAKSNLLKGLAEKAVEGHLDDLAWANKTISPEGELVGSAIPKNKSDLYMKLSAERSLEQGQRKMIGDTFGDYLKTSGISPTKQYAAIAKQRPTSMTTPRLELASKYGGDLEDLRRVNAGIPVPRSKEDILTALSKYNATPAGQQAKTDFLNFQKTFIPQREKIMEEFVGPRRFSAMQAGRGTYLTRKITDPTAPTGFWDSLKQKLLSTPDSKAQTAANVEDATSASAPESLPQKTATSVHDVKGYTTAPMNLHYETGIRDTVDDTNKLIGLLSDKRQIKAILDKFGIPQQEGVNTPIGNLNLYRRIERKKATTPNAVTNPEATYFQNVENNIANGNYGLASDYVSRVYPRSKYMAIPKEVSTQMERMFQPQPGKVQQLLNKYSITNALTTPNNLLRAAATGPWATKFLTANPFYDLVGSYPVERFTDRYPSAYSPKELAKFPATSAKTVFNNLSDSTRAKNEMLKSFQYSGAGGSRVYGIESGLEPYSMAKNAYEKATYAPKAVGEFVASVGRGLEEGPRFNQFKRIISTDKDLLKMANEGTLVDKYRAGRMTPKQSKKMQDAMYAANNITVDFKRGTPSSRLVNSIIPYYNPSIQGGYNTVEQLINDPNTYLKRQGVLTGIQGINNARMQFSNGLDYMALHPAVRGSNLALAEIGRSGDKTGRSMQERPGDIDFLSIPFERSGSIPTDLLNGAVNKYLPKLMAKSANPTIQQRGKELGEYQKASSEIERTQRSDDLTKELLSKLAGRTAVGSVALAATAGRDSFTGQPIVPDYLLDKPASQQVNIGTKNIDRFLSQVAQKIPGVNKTKVTSPLVMEKIRKTLTPPVFGDVANAALTQANDIDKAIKEADIVKSGGQLPLTPPEYTKQLKKKIFGKINKRRVPANVLAYVNDKIDKASSDYFDQYGGGTKGFIENPSWRKKNNILDILSDNTAEIKRATSTPAFYKLSELKNAGLIKDDPVEAVYQKILHKYGADTEENLTNKNLFDIVIGRSLVKKGYSPQTVATVLNKYSLPPQPYFNLQKRAKEEFNR